MTFNRPPSLARRRAAGAQRVVRDLFDAVRTRAPALAAPETSSRPSARYHLARLSQPPATRRPGGVRKGVNMYRGGQSARGYEDYTRPNGGYINLGAPSSPGQPISVPTAYGTGPHDRYIPGRAPVASSSFHASGPNAYGNHPSVPGPGLWGQSGSMTGRRGGGYADRQRDDDWRAWAEPSGWGSGDRDEDRAKRHKAKGLARAQARPPRAPSDSPNKKARKAAEKRKAEQDAQSAADFERKAAAARRREDFKRQALAKAKMIRPDSPAAEGENVRALGATDLLFEMKKSARSQSTDGTSKATRNAGQDASSKRETEKRKKNVEKGKGKGRASDQESLEFVPTSYLYLLLHPLTPRLLSHYYTRENKKPTSKTRRSSQTETGRGRLKKARGGRGGFEDSDDDGRVSTPPASPRRSPRKKDKGKGKARLQTSGAVTVESDDDLEIVEKEKTLEELFRQDREEADEAERAARGESAVPQPTQALLKLRADRLDSPDPLLENDSASFSLLFFTRSCANFVTSQTQSLTPTPSALSATACSPTSRATSSSASSATSSTIPMPTADPQ